MMRGKIAYTLFFPKSLSFSFPSSCYPERERERERSYIIITRDKFESNGTQFPLYDNGICATINTRSAMIKVTPCAYLREAGGSLLLNTDQVRPDRVARPTLPRRTMLRVHLRVYIDDKLDSPRRTNERKPSRDRMCARLHAVVGARARARASPIVLRQDATRLCVEGVESARSAISGLSWNDSSISLVH